MSKKNFLFPFVLLLLISCKKDGFIEYEFEGIVIDEYTKDRIPGATIKFSQKLISNNIDFTEIDEITSDANGGYKINFEREKATELQISVKKENHFDYLKNIYTSEISTENTNSFDFEMETKSFIQFSIYNSSPDEEDQLNLILNRFKEDCDECARNGTQSFTGAVDTLLNYVTTGNRFVKFTYVNLVSGFFKEDSIYTTPFDTTTYTIVY